MKVQYFSFFPNKIEASDFCSALRSDKIQDWDFALVEEDNALISYIVKYKSVTCWTTRWTTLGYNAHRLGFMQPGIHGYTKDTEHLRQYAK